MTDTILENLKQIEQKHDIRILYALESGSRAWGFASRDSDYDVRFIYIHPLDWYLSIRDKRDVIEIPISDDLDISGWDIRKALGLFIKSNPPLLEWLGSPIVYQDDFGFADILRDMLRHSFSPQRCLYHYLHMAKGNFREYLKGDLVRVKKYFYVLRPILACCWIEKYNTMPPTEFERLYSDASLSPELVVEINQLLERKKAGDELDMEPKIEIINTFLDERIEHFSASAKRTETRDKDIVLLDDLFREMLQKVWVKE
ncbi:MAG: nucleotidyltransferase domain-containing protein [Deltaproteobacteria bacterium]|nr:nucleotidyltransferase domain-containing protein [Deltaproteobacteria bacterium]